MFALAKHVLNFGWEYHEFKPTLVDNFFLIIQLKWKMEFVLNDNHFVKKLENNKIYFLIILLILLHINKIDKIKKLK